MNKYHARKTTVDGITFDSQKEANYFCELKLLLRSHIVKKFNTQVTFELQPSFERNGEKYRAINYVADFVVEYADGHTEVVDIKGVRTKDYLIKKKLLLYKNPEIDFKETFQMNYKDEHGGL